MKLFFLSLITVLIPVSLAYFLTPFYIKRQEKRKIMVTNFLGEKVPTTGGLILLTSLLSVQPLYFFMEGWRFPRFLMLLYVAGITLLGLADDLFGDKKCKGFRGHFKMLWRKKIISTGIYKAAGGFLLGTLTTALAGGGCFNEWLLKGFFLALFSNFFNLLDTRPARAGKIFLFFSLVSMIFFRELSLTLFPLLSALYIYLFWESERKIMLGDTGAYLLGGVLGFPLVLLLTPRWLIIFNIFLLLLHFYCEKFSLSKILESKMFIRLEGPERGN